MRRGALLSAKGVSPLVAVDPHDDMEGGGSLGGSSAYPPQRRASSSGSCGCLPTMDIGNINSPPGSGNVSHAYFTWSKSSDYSLKFYGIILIAGTLVVTVFLPLACRILGFVYAAVAFGAVASLWLSVIVLQSDDGTPEMRAVSDPIREGAEGFLKVQYSVRSSAVTTYASYSVASLCYNGILGLSSCVLLYVLFTY